MTLNGKAYNFEYCMLLIVNVECASITEGQKLKIAGKTTVKDYSDIR